jgi:hypothetical protein
MEADELPDIVFGKKCNMWTVSKMIIIFIKQYLLPSVWQKGRTLQIFFYVFMWFEVS